MGRVFQRGGVWWIAYYYQGREVRESSGSTKRPAGVKLLKKRHRELAAGRPAREAEKVLLSDLRALIEADYRLNGRRSGRRMAHAWAHLVEHFGAEERAVSITAPRLAAYVNARTGEGAKGATIRNELNALKRAFNLARRAGELMPNETPASWPAIRAGAPRAGFFEREEHEAVKAALPADEADVAEFLYWCGWRRTEATGLRWREVDLDAGIIRIETTKTDEPRTLPFGVLPQLRDLLQHRREVTDRVQRDRGMVVSHVFHRNGDPIVTFFRTWAAACVKAGFGTEERAPEVTKRDGTKRDGRLLRRTISRIPHDYRRSAARNLSRAGVPERVIMQLCGWKTRSVFDRYRIVSESELGEGLAKLAADADAGATKTPKVRRLRKRSAEHGQNTDNRAPKRGARSR
jgi:integrase